MIFGVDKVGTAIGGIDIMSSLQFKLFTEISIRDKGIRRRIDFKGSNDLVCFAFP